MKDTINKQDAINALREEFKRVPTNAIRATQVVENLPPAQPEQRWIPCEEKLPEPLEKVLVTFEEYGERYVTIGYTNWYRNVLMWNLPYGGKAIAWQPRPKPYKEQQDGKIT